MDKCAYITVTKKGVIVEAPYNQQAVEEIKSIPHTERQWYPEDKKWIVQPGYLDFVKTLVKKHYSRCQLVEGAIVTDLHTGEAIEQGTLF